MSTYPPFIAPLKTPSCPAAWRGGKRGPPCFSSWKDGDLARSGVHALLRAAGLPRAELLHMGATRELLANSSAVIHESEVAPLLGRIVQDAMSHRGERPQQSIVYYGTAVIEEWFS